MGVGWEGRSWGVNVLTLVGVGFLLQTSYAGVTEKPPGDSKRWGQVRSCQLLLGKASCCSNSWSKQWAKRI